MNRLLRRLVMLLHLVSASVVAAQTTSPGPAVDVEVYGSLDGSNTICAVPGDAVFANVFVRPATGPGTAVDCALLCGSTVGGPANIAAAAIDIGFDRTHLEYLNAANNPDPIFAAIDGLIQTQNLGDGRVGWALAGDWTPDANTAGSLADPCAMLKLDRADWVVRIGFSVIASGPTVLELRNDPVFPLSFTDVCVATTYRVENSGIDELVSATVATSSPQCPQYDNFIFRNGFETGRTSAWR